MTGVNDSAIDDLRAAYRALGWLKWFFPRRIAKALIDLENPSVLPSHYTHEQKNNILAAFTKTNGLLKLLFSCLRHFQASSLFRAYQHHIQNPTLQNMPSGTQNTTRSVRASTVISSNAMESPSPSPYSPRLFTPSKQVQQVKELLQYVALGKQNEAEQVLKLYPALLTIKSEFTDCSGRTFHQVSPWEYMLWTLDTLYMGQMMLDALPEGANGDFIRQECLTQYTIMEASDGGIYYEQPAPRKPLVKIEANPNPNNIRFADIESLFDTPDAVLLGGQQFYYANKQASLITAIEPSDELSAEERTDLDKLKISINMMDLNTSRMPSSLKEYQLLNTLFKNHSAFKPTHHHEAHYNFGIINALQTYKNCVAHLNKNKRKHLWINQIAAAQQQAPLHVLQHYCDTDTNFHPVPPFNAQTFKRESYYYHYQSSELVPLLQENAFDPHFGFQFGLSRGITKVACLQLDLQDSVWRNEIISRELAALQKLAEERIVNTKQLQERLCQSLAVPINNAAIASNIA